MPKKPSNKDDPPSPISPVFPSSPPINRKPAGKPSPIARRKVHMEEEDDEDAISGVNHKDDLDDDEEEEDDQEEDEDEEEAINEDFSAEEDNEDDGLGAESNLSIPMDQKKQLAQVESSFRHSSPGSFAQSGRGEDADLSIVGGVRPSGYNKSGKNGVDRSTGSLRSDMGPPVLPASAYRRGKSNESVSKKGTARSQLGRTSSALRERQGTSSPMPDLPTGDDSGISNKSISRDERLESFSSPSLAAQTRSISRNISNQFMTPKASREVPPSSDATPLEAKVRKPRLKSQRSRSSISSVGSERVSDLEDNGTHGSSRKASDFDFGFGGEGKGRGAGASRSTSRLTSERSVSRNPSFGSVASTVTVGAAADKTLGDLDEEGGSGSDTDRGPATPRSRITGQSDPIPPETQLNAQIRNIKVPETIARDFRKREASNGSFSPSKKPPGTASRNMTLKEQSGTIDKLQKENWDLRIKVFHLSNRLDKVSEESVKDLQNENGILAVENTQLKSHVKTLKKRIKQLEQSNGEASSVRNGSDDMEGGSREEITTLETEVTYWKERSERVDVEVETLRTKVQEKESQCERLSEIVRGMAGGGEELETLRDYLESETKRRKQAEDDNAKLRNEIWDLKAAAQANSHDINSRTKSSMSYGSDNTLVSQLRQENEELRREVGAQTSMLTSRNREKERLYQEIEDLKLGLIRNDNQLTIASDYDRALSRVSGNSLNNMNEVEREEYENANGVLRDRISEHKLKIQDLEIELETKLRELDNVVIQRQEFGDLAAEYEEELEVLNADLQVVIAERNDQVRLREELEQDFDNLKQEAEEEIQRLEEELDIRAGEMERMEEDLRNREENFGALQEEMRALSTVVVKLEDSAQERLNKVQNLEAELGKSQKTINDNEAEMTSLEKQIVELSNKTERLGVQQESAQGEITFLREEQDGDKIKIGQLESALKAAEESLKDEKERSRSLSDRLVEERKLMDETRNMNKQEVEKLISDKNQEILNMKEAARQLKKTLARREGEVNEWKSKLNELEASLSETLGDLSGTRTDILKSIVNLQQELEKRMEELNKAKSDLANKDRTLNDRENLMESMALETRKLQDLLDKERQARKGDKSLAETLQAANEKSRRTIAQYQSQFADLEKARSKDSRNLSQLESQYKDQIAERNSLLVQLWQRLSVLCGSEWADKNKLLGKGGVTQPAEMVVSTHLSGFSKTTLSAIKHLEGILSGFRTRIRNIERDLWKEYAVVESTLETRTRRLERLEAMVRDGVGEQSAMRNEITKLRTENRLLKAELNVVRLQPSSKLPVKASSGTSTPQDALTVPPGTGLNRSHSTTAISAPEAAAIVAPITNTMNSLDEVTDETERRWILRLRELEKRLKAEREARLLDRNGAKQRLEEARGEREQLKKELERERAVSRLARNDEEEDDKKKRSSMIPKPKGISGRPREIDDTHTGGVPDEDDVRSLIVRVERERREHRTKSRDRHKSRDLRNRENPEDSGRDRSRDRVKDGRESKLRGEKERSSSDRGSSHKSSANSAKSSARRDSLMGKGITQVSSLDELNARMERAKSPTKKESTYSPRKLLGFLSSNKKDVNE